MIAKSSAKAFVKTQTGKNQLSSYTTDTMTVTAEFCQKQIQMPKVPIVFTGAMIPMGFEDSDATQNVTEALYATRFLTPGFYISFHNQIFEVPQRPKKQKRKKAPSKQKVPGPESSLKGASLLFRTHRLRKSRLAPKKGSVGSLFV